MNETDKNYNDKDWVYNKFGDCYIPDYHKGMFDFSSSETVFDKYYWKYLNEIDKGVVVYLGSDSGLIYDYLKKRFAGSQIIFYIYDFEYVVEKKEVDDKVGNIKLLPFGAFNDISKDEALVLAIFRQDFYIYRALCVIEDYLSEYRNVIKECEVFLQKFKYSQMALLGYRAFYIVNLLNVPFLDKPFIQLKNTFKGDRAIVLAGGPSLNDSINKIKSFRSAFVVFCVARVSHIVSEEGVIPDFVVAVDPSEMSYNNSVKALDISDESALICSNHTHPRIIGQWKSEVYYLGDLLPWESELNSENITGAGPTVTNTAIKAAMEMGFKEILLAGVDLCHDAKGFSHAKGSAEAQAGPCIKNDTIKIYNYENEIVETTVDFYTAIDTLKLQAILAKKNGVYLYNMSSKAARVEDIELLSDDYFTRSLHNTKSNVYEQSSRDVTGFLKVLKEEIISKCDKVVEIKDLIAELDLVNKPLFHENKLNEKVLKDTRKVEKLIDNLPVGFDKFLKGYGLRSFYIKGAADVVVDMKPDDLTLYNKAYFESYYDTLNEVHELLEQSVQRIDGRLLELSNECDVSEYESYLKKYGLYLRVEKYFNTHNVNYNEKFKSLKKSMLDLFLKDRAVAEQKDKLRFSFGFTDIDFFSKAQRLFTDKSIDALEVLITHAANNLENVMMSVYLEGLVLELQDKKEQALLKYQGIIESGSANNMLLKYTLERVFTVASENDNYMALQAIECLSLISPYYLKHYAESLFLLGDHFKAIDKFAEYHKHFPQDVSNLLRLSQVYEIIGHPDQAKKLLYLMYEEYPDRKDILSALRKLEHDTCHSD